MKPLVALLLAVGPTLASAHNFWLEPASGVLRAHYGEPEIAMRESTPGKLDELQITRLGPAADGGPAPSGWRKDRDGFTLGTLRPGAPAFAEARAVAVRRSATDRDGTLALYYARHATWPLSASPAVMTLDIVPANAAGTFSVFFNGAPLTGGTVKVIAPSLWIQIHDIDERGQVRITTPWRGLYVLDVETRQARQGEHEGQRFGAVMHRATLSFTRPDGPAFDQPVPPQYRAN